VVLAAPPAWAQGRILVAPREGLRQAEFDGILRGRGARILRKLNRINVHVVRVPPRAEEAVARALSRNPRIKFAEKDVLVQLEQVIPNDPRYPNAWHLPMIDAPSAWQFALGDNISVAILDTGVDASHPDLAAKLLPGWNAASGNADTTDINGHGTLVAGTTAATSNNAIGVASVAWNAMIMPLRVTNSTDGSAFVSTIADALIWAADNGAKVANISYGVSNSASVSSAAQYMRNRGGVVVVAAGNSGTNPGYADNPYMISVSATTSSDVKASWSSFGNYVDVAAPGAGIWTTSRGGGYGAVSGTSFSSPNTAGVVALIMSANPLLSPGEVESILETTANDLGVAGWDQQYGHGRVNAFNAVAAAAGQTQPPDAEPPVATILSPSEGITVSASVPVDVTASDNVGVARVDLYVDGNLVGSDSTSPFGFVWDSASVADGWASVSAYAYDEAGNESAPGTVKRSYADVRGDLVNEDYSASVLSDLVWLDDGVPAGASLSGSWNWVSSAPAPLSGALAHQSVLAAGLHQHYFRGATQTLSVGVGDTLFAYVYLDPVNPPRQVMLQWNDGNWEHRAYWGENLINWGVDGTVSRRYLGPLPVAGQWVRLEVPASLVGLEGRVVNGMAFTLYDGRATWDSAGVSAP
jgi:hypothetical protein